MTNKLKGDIVAWLHLSFILFGIVSLPLIFIFDFWSILVMIFGGLSVFSWIIYKGKCWITSWENYYRKKDGNEYNIGFIKFYLKKVFKIEATPFRITMILYSYLLLLFIFSFIKIL